VIDVDEGGLIDEAMKRQDAALVEFMLKMTFPIHAVTLPSNGGYLMMRFPAAGREGSALRSLSRRRGSAFQYILCSSTRMAVPPGPSAANDRATWRPREQKRGIRRSFLGYAAALRTYLVRRVRHCATSLPSATVYSTISTSVAAASLAASRG
jgi:hypothetical protein